MATKEEYLLKFEGSLLEKLSENHRLLNKSLFTSFSLFLFFLLFEFNLINRTETEIIGYKLNLTEDQLLLLLPCLLMIPYFLINNSIRNIIRIVKLLKENSQQLLVVNEDSRPFLVQDLELYSIGIVGIQFQFAKWIVRRYLNKKLIEFSIEVPKKKDPKTKMLFMLKLSYRLWSNTNRAVLRFMKTIIWIMLLAALYLLPLSVISIFIYDKQIYLLLQHFEFENLLNTSAIVFILLIGMAIYTLFSNLILYSLYSTDLIQLKENLGKDGLVSLNQGFRKLLDYFYKE